MAKSQALQQTISRLHFMAKDQGHIAPEELDKSVAFFSETLHETMGWDGKPDLKVTAAACMLFLSQLHVLMDREIDLRKLEKSTTSAS